MIEEYIREKGIDFSLFTEWALGTRNANVYLDQVPDRWNERHPEVFISWNDEIKESLEKMCVLYLAENKQNNFN